MCSYRVNGRCTLAESLVRDASPQAVVACKEDAYQACCSNGCPNSFNSVSASLAFAAIRNLPQTTLHKLLFAKIREGKECLANGPGTQLKLLLSKFGFKPNSSACKCDYYAALMDYNGVQWCKDNLTFCMGMLRQGIASNQESWKVAIVKAFLNLAGEATEEAIFTKLILMACERAK